jgi:cell wall-associated NlpC family hydrolase
MLSRLVVSGVVAWLVAPLTLSGQISLSSISVRDVERAVRIGRVVLETHDAVAATKSKGGSARTARRAVATGHEYVGVPYKWGGSTPRGFDCSGFVQYVYREHGVRLPRTSRQMAHAGRSVPARIASLRAGDLMMFRGKNGVISHVALYAGNNQILHSSSSGRGVRYDNLSSKRGRYYATHFVTARRVTENGRSLVQALAEIYLKYPFDYFDPPDAAPRPR